MTQRMGVWVRWLRLGTGDWVSGSSGSSDRIRRGVCRDGIPPDAFRAGTLNRLNRGPVAAWLDRAFKAE